MTPALTGNNTSWSSQTNNSIASYKSGASCLTSGTCTNDAPAVSEFSADKTQGCETLTVAFTDLSTNTPTSWSWNFGDGGTSSQQNPTHTYNSTGNFNVTLSASNSFGGTPATKNQYIKVQAGGPYPTVKGGPASNTAVGAGGYFNTNDIRGLVFDALQGVIIESVKVYANTAGDRVIEVQDAVGGNTVVSKTVNIPAGESRVNLGFAVPAGTDYHIKVTGSLVDLYRNNAGASFPYDVGGLVSITQTDYASTDPNYYYYFYDWEVRKEGCDPSTGVGDQPISGTFELYPNPSSNLVTVKLLNPQVSVSQVQVYDMLGKRVNPPMKQLGSQQVQLDFRGWKRGIYLIRVGNDSNGAVQRLVIM
ncbi:MAG: PKD domain-containing protein [Flavobacteriales bacterium]|nr:PKD domain-containing protein [Flavobacteriales bacterium]